MLLLFSSRVLGLFIQFTVRVFLQLSDSVCVSFRFGFEGFESNNS